MTSRHRGPAWALIALSIPVIAALLVSAADGPAQAATTINLGTAAAASVLAGSGVTNTGPSILPLDLDTWPSPAITGFPPGLDQSATHRADAVAQQAQSDLTIAYNAAAAAPSTNNVTGVNLAGKTLLGGVYTSSSTVAIAGPTPLTLNGDASSVWIFQAGSSLLVSPGSSVVITGGANACNIFWQVGSSATIGAGARFQGNILALTSITNQTGATIVGRELARNGDVTLEDNVFTNPTCGGTGSTTTTTAPASTTTTTPASTTTTVASTTTTIGSTTTTTVGTTTTTSVGTTTTTTAPASTTTTTAPASTTSTTTSGAKGEFKICKSVPASEAGVLVGPYYFDYSYAANGGTVTGRLRVPPGYCSLVQTNVPQEDLVTVTEEPSAVGHVSSITVSYGSAVSSNPPTVVFALLPNPTRGVTIVSYTNSL